MSFILSITSPTKCFHMNQSVKRVKTKSQKVWQLWHLYKGSYHNLNFVRIWPRWSWFKFNNLGLALGTNLKFYTSLSKELKLKVKKFLGLILTFVEVTGEKLVGGLFAPPLPSWIGLTETIYNEAFWKNFWRFLSRLFTLCFSSSRRLLDLLRPRFPNSGLFFVLCLWPFNGMFWHTLLLSIIRVIVSLVLLILSSFDA